MSQRLLIVSPLHNEAIHVGRLVAAMMAQTRKPDEWVLVDDGSTDGTAGLVRELTANVAFARFVVVPARAPRAGGDRLGEGAAARAFNVGVSAASAGDWTLVGKVDGDLELPPDYFERLLDHLADDPRLGIVGGVIHERRPDGRWRELRVPAHHVPGAVKLYTRECLLSIGGVQERLGWDTIDEMYARMHGFGTRSIAELRVKHHRRTGGAHGVIRGRARHGACAWIAHYPLYFVLLRSVKLARERPVGLLGAAFLWGYVDAARRKTPRVADRAFRAHVRAELRGRIALRRGAGADSRRTAS